MNRLSKRKIAAHIRYLMRCEVEMNTQTIYFWRKHEYKDYDLSYISKLPAGTYHYINEDNPTEEQKIALRLVAELHNWREDD